MPLATISTTHGDTSYKLKHSVMYGSNTPQRVCSKSILVQCIISGGGCMMHTQQSTAQREQDSL